MAGRFELIQAEHWNFGEAQEIFGLSFEEYVKYGCYPGSIPFLKEDLTRWADYVKNSIVEPAIGRDLMQLHPIQNPALFRQVFGVAVNLPAQVISLQKMMGQLQEKGSIPTIQHYLSLLSQAFLVSGIEKYSPQPIRSKKSSPKLIVHDNALIRAFEKPVSMEMPSDKFGRYLENSIGARLIESGWETTYWQDRNHEVDFITFGPQGERWAIEVKSAKTSAAELKGLFKFCSIYKDFEPILVTPVDQTIEGVRILPAQEILKFHRKYPIPSA